MRPASKKPKIDDSSSQAAMATEFAQSFCAFNDRCPSPYHVAQACRERLLEPSARRPRDARLVRGRGRQISRGCASGEHRQREEEDPDGAASDRPVRFSRDASARATHRACDAVTSFAEVDARPSSPRASKCNRSLRERRVPCERGMAHTSPICLCRSTYPFAV